MPDLLSNPPSGLGFVGLGGSSVQQSGVGGGIPMLQSLADLQNTTNQNRLFQGKVAAGQMLQKFVRPDGTIDIAGYNQALVNNPLTAPYRQQALEDAAVFQGQQLTNTTTGLGIANTAVSNLAADVASVPANPDMANDPSVMEARAARVAAGLASGRYGPNGAQIAAAYAGNGGFTDARAKQFAIQTGAGPEMQAQGMAPITYQGAGGALVPTAINQVTGKAGPVQGSAPIPVTMSPEAMGAMIGIKRDDGSVVNVPRSEIETADGKGIPNVMGPDGSPLTGPHGEVLGALPAGQEGALASNVQNQQDRANALQTAFDNGSGNTSAQRKALLEEMRQVQGDFASGPGAAKWAGIVTEFNRMFGTSFTSDVSNKSAAEQVFGKMAQMVAAQQRDTLGLPSTNAGEAAAELAAPNTTYSPQANLSLIGQLEGNEDLLQKKQAAWTKFQKAGGSYNDFASQFNRAYDPRFFWDQYAPSQTQATAGMTPAQAKEYERRKARAMALKF